MLTLLEAENRGGNMRAVISGATGAVGMALVELLEKNQIETLVLCHKGSNRSSRINESKYIKKAFCDASDFESFSMPDSDRYDVFFHFAWCGTTGEARNDMYLQNLNVKYTLDALKLAKRLGCDTFIGAGSQAEYGRVEGVLTPQTPTRPENGYGIAKLCASQMSRELASRLGIRHVWTRILSVYGPYDSDSTMVMLVIRALLRGEVPKLTAGEQTWDYLYSRDAARAFLALAKGGKDGCVYCLGGGSSRPLKKYVYAIRDAIDKNAEADLGAIPYAPKQVMHLEADISTLTEDTGFVPEYSFEKGIEETVVWARQNP